LELELKQKQEIEMKQQQENEFKQNQQEILKKQREYIEDLKQKQELKKKQETETNLAPIIDLTNSSDMEYNLPISQGQNDPFRFYSPNFQPSFNIFSMPPSQNNKN